MVGSTSTNGTVVSDDKETSSKNYFKTTRMGGNIVLLFPRDDGSFVMVVDRTQAHEFVYTRNYDPSTGTWVGGHYACYNRTPRDKVFAMVLEDILDMNWLHQQEVE